LPILIELVFVFGAVLLFAWWQLQEIKVDQRKAAEKRAAEDRRTVRGRRSCRAGTAADAMAPW
jgi:hypothetical protein